MKYYVKSDGTMIIRTAKAKGKKGFVAVTEKDLEREKNNALNVEGRRIYARLQREIRRSLAAPACSTKKVNPDFWDDVKLASNPGAMRDKEATADYNSNNYIRDFKTRSMINNKKERAVDLVGGALNAACGLD